MAAACLFAYTYAIAVVITCLALSVIASIWCFTGYKKLDSLCIQLPYV